MKKLIIGKGGRGAYDLPYDPDYIIILPCGRVFLIADCYCGSPEEGYCYRRHFAEIRPVQIPDVIRAASGDWTYEDLGIELKRMARSPVWLRRAVASAEKS
jgi:hypothetical protein